MGLKDPISTTMMRVLFVAIAAVMLLSSTDAHLDQLCSSTCAAHPGRIDFYFGTYHGIQEAKNSPGGKAPGTIYLSNSGGSKLTSSFKEMFAPSSTFTITTVDATKAALIKAVNNPSILDAKCMVSCYSTYGAENLPTPVGNPAGKWVVPVDPTLPYSKWGCKVGKTVNFWSRVSVNKATSGDWKLEITGTNASSILMATSSAVCPRPALGGSVACRSPTARSPALALLLSLPVSTLPPSLHARTCSVVLSAPTGSARTPRPPSPAASSAPRASTCRTPSARVPPLASLVPRRPSTASRLVSTPPRRPSPTSRMAASVS